MTATVDARRTGTHTRTRPARRVPRSVTVSAWAVPVMVVGQFALISGVPVAIALIGALRRVREPAARWAAAVLAVTYVVPLTVWLTRPDGAESLSKDMHPVFAAVIVAASAALVVALRRARSSRS
ncbi:hypothetical protein [Streptomyces spectabilis]|uniref:Uncharacterized protein n=1 Tax=Streptomyces spectabilis TaxID=68270 RepID=A0A516R248_STRST|nr:hypothetical protein [Streptomyces spectabilis]QDQ09735.1 hypothetical protein FH965_03485 [Streptomyces spectabilis]